MSFYDDASWLLIPSGIKEDVVFAQKPTSGLGDLTFTRASDATYTDSTGVIRRSPYNLLQYSEQFDNAVWGKLSGTTVTANQGIAPNGTLTADLITEGTATLVYFALNQFRAGTYTQSYYAKKGTGDIFGMYFGSGFTARFNLTSGTIVSTSNATATIQSVGNGWYRCTATATPTSDFYAGISYANAIGLTVFAWGAQLVEGTSALDYFPTTNRQDVPRIDFRNADGTLSSCGRLLLEPQRTNLLTFSEQLDNTDWSKTNVTISANATTSPSGTTSADKIVADSSAGDKIVFQVKTITTGQAFTISAFFKKSEYKLAFVRAGGQTAAPYVIYNLDTQAVVSTSGVSSTKIEHYGNGWYRVSLTLNSATSATCAPNILFLPDSGYTLNVLNIPSYTGDGTSGGFVWGCQLEANGAAYATTYIPTTTAAVTRLADTASKTGVSSLIGQTEGTLFLDFESGANDSVDNVFGINDGTSSSRVIIFRSVNNTIIAQVRVGGGSQALIASLTVTPNTRYKCAVGYKLNDVVFYINGGQIGVDTSATIPTCSVISTDTGSAASYFHRPINQAALFPTRLTNEQLAQLTTL